jgi:hypothetical protein
VKTEDVLIEADRDGGLVILRGEGTMIDRKNSVRVSSVMARALRAFKDDIEELKGLAKKKGGK